MAAKLPDGAFAVSAAAYGWNGRMSIGLAELGRKAVTGSAYPAAAAVNVDFRLILSVGRRYPGRRACFFAWCGLQKNPFMTHRDVNQLQYQGSNPQ